VRVSTFTKGLIFVLIAAILAGGFIFVNRILAGDAFSKEEAQHALYGLWLWRDMQALDFGAFWYDTLRQMNWPFLHSWVLSLSFTVFGVSYTAARFLSLIFFLSSVIMLYLLSGTLSKKTGWKIGVLACLLALTSPILVRFASENMLEGLGALLFVAVAYVYTICEEQKDILHYILLAILFGLALFTNYMYAYFIIPSFLVVTLSKLGPLFVEGIRLRRQGEKYALRFLWWGYRKMIVLSVFLLVIAGWLAVDFSRKIVLIMASIFSYSGGVSPVGFWQTLFYYPKVIISNLSFSPWIGAFLLIALFIPFIASRYQGLNRIYVYVWTTLILAALTIPAKAPQVIYIIIPFIFLIFSAALVYVVTLGMEKQKQLARALLVLFIIPILFSVPRAYGLFFPGKSSQNMVKVLKYFHGTIPKEAGVVSSINLEHFSPEVVKFHFRDWQGEVLAETDLAEEELFSDGSGQRYFVSLNMDWKSPYTNDVLDDSLSRWNAWLTEKEMMGHIRLYSTKRFDDIGVTARIYQQTTSGI